LPIYHPSTNKDTEALVLLVKNKSMRKIAGALETLNWLSVRLLLKDRASYQLFPGMIFRDYMRLAHGDRWRCASIFQVIEEIGGVPRRITLDHLPGEGIDTPLDELAYLAIITKSIDPRLIFEIGTFRGRTALNFALNSDESCKVLTLDLAPADRETATKTANPADAKIIDSIDLGASFTGSDVAGRITQLYGDSTRFNFEPYFGKVDLVFVDGGHTTDVVLSDTRNALELARRGGVIMWHDFGNYGDYNDVTRAVLQLIPAQEVVQVENSQLALYRKPVI
jgi:predicted O-methyltransferase YrrM